jgi:hypothetical protein
MTKAPYLLPGARAGYRLGDGELVDSMMYDGLYCQFDHCAMGLSTERYNDAAGISRQAQDNFAALSHERAAAAIKEGRFADEIVPVSVKQRKGDPIVVDTDEGVRPGTTAESLGALKPAFDKEGTVTAGNASQISDGGAAVIVTSRAKADALGVAPMGEVFGYGQVAGPDASLLLQPANAIAKALEKAGQDGRRYRPVRDQRGLRRGRPGLDGRPRDQRRDHQRERRGHRPRSPHRHVGDPAGPDRSPRAQASGRRHGRRQPVRRGRPGRRPARPNALLNPGRRRGLSDPERRLIHPGTMNQTHERARQTPMTAAGGASPPPRPPSEWAGARATTPAASTAASLPLS